jgi:hypothetical protein
VAKGIVARPGADDGPAVRVDEVDRPSVAVVLEVEQASGLRHGPTLMLIDDADKPAKWYFALETGAAGGERRAPDGGAGNARLAELKAPLPPG